MPYYRSKTNLLSSIERRLSKVDWDLIIFDTREKNTKVVKFLESKGISLKFQALPEGDYFIENEDILIERKVLSDLSKSITSGRLYSQIDRLSKTGKRILLLIEGEQGFGKLHSNGLLGAQLSVCFRFQIPTIRTKNYLETINILILILEKIKKGGYGEFKQYFEKNVKAEYIKNPQIKILTSLPNCGEKMAQKILDKFGTIKNFINADEKEILEIPGLGPKTLKKWKNILQ